MIVTHVYDNDTFAMYSTLPARFKAPLQKDPNSAAKLAAIFAASNDYMAAHKEKVAKMETWEEYRQHMQAGYGVSMDISTNENLVRVMGYHIHGDEKFTHLPSEQWFYTTPEEMTAVAQENNHKPCQYNGKIFGHLTFDVVTE